MHQFVSLILNSYSRTAVDPLADPWIPNTSVRRSGVMIWIFQREELFKSPLESCRIEQPRRSTANERIVVPRNLFPSEWFFRWIEIENITFIFQECKGKNSLIEPDWDNSKVECVFSTIVVSILLFAEFGPEDHLKDAPHYMTYNL